MIIVLIIRLMARVSLNLGGTVSGDILSTNEAGGFTGAMIGLYATSVGY